MSTQYTVTLVLHVLSGLLGTAGAYALWLHLLRPKMNLPAIRAWAYSTFFFLMFAWVMSAWYYVRYYGASVKPVILAGKYPWAHKVFMEWKEHIFLFLPFMAAALLFAVWKLQPESPGADSRRRAAVWLAAAMTVVALAVTLSGVAVSGAVRFPRT